MSSAIDSWIGRKRDLPLYLWRRVGERSRSRQPSYQPDPACTLRLGRWVGSWSEPTLSVCIPTSDRLDLLAPCLESLAATTSGRSIEMIIGDNGCTSETREFCAAVGIKTVAASGSFSFSRMCNLMAHGARGDSLLFLNDDTIAISQDWMDRLLATQNGAIVGAALVYPGTWRLQHAGVKVVSHRRWPQPNAYPSWRKQPTGSSVALQNIGLGRPLASVPATRASVMAVSGAFLCTSAQTFWALDGFDESFGTDLQDIDLCLRARANGVDVICRRDIVFSHQHAGTRGRYEFPLPDWRLFSTRWAGELARWQGQETAESLALTGTAGRE